MVIKAYHTLAFPYELNYECGQVCTLGFWMLAYINYVANLLERPECYDLFEKLECRIS